MRRRIGFLAFAVVLGALALAQAGQAATIRVVTTTDDGPGPDCLPLCSLRGAIEAANRTTEADTIVFDILPAGPKTISLLSPLPAITQPLTIDGTTQDGWIGPPIVEVTTANPDITTGLSVDAPGSPSVLRGLVVNSFDFGIAITNGALEGSYVGTNMSGSAARGNGVGVVAGSNSTIGGTTAAARNLISGNAEVGIRIVGTQNVVEGNDIGVDAAGTGALANEGDGIRIEGGSSNQIGGGPVQANVIATNGDSGIEIVRGDSNSIVGNRIGTNREATADLGNGGSGILIVSGDGNRIGDVEFPGNVIRDNGQTNTGIRILGGVRNSVVNNRIIGNGGLGIDLGPSGVTANDTGDGDEGANDLQNFPVLTSAETNGTDSIVIRGTLETVTGRARVEFFANPTCDASQHGEGARFLGATIVDTGGVVEVVGGFEVPVAVGESITATATRDGNTSEFSRCFTATGGGGGGTIVVNSTADPGDGECTRSECTLREAISQANSNPDVTEIDFDIASGDVPYRILLASDLPAITETVDIDGTSQPDYEGTPVIRLDGFRQVTNVLTLQTSESVVRGLLIQRANAAGIAVTGNGNTLAQNEIGSDDLGNDTGVLVNGSNNQIGGLENENEISFNDGRGVVVATGTGNRISRNSIHSNTGLGIDLAPAGVTPNDPNDADEGANDRQNFPEVDLVEEVSGGLEVSGLLRSTPSSTFTVEIFGDSECDPSGGGEGRIFLGTSAFETNSDGIGSFGEVVELRDGVNFITTTAIAGNGSTSEFSACRAIGDTGEGLTLTVDQGSNPAGSNTRVVGLDAIPSNQLNAFSGGPDSAPVGSIPVGSIPVGSIPVGSIPVGSIPVGSIPVGSIPVGSIPVGSIPVGSIGLSAIPVGSIGLDQILLTQLPVDWTPILAGTPLANRVLQTLTLADVYGDATARARFEQLTLAQSGLHTSLLGGVTFAALLLGEKTLSQLPPPGAPTWCDAIQAAGGDCTGVNVNTNTVAGLSIASAPVGSIPVGSIPVGSIAGGIAGTPVGSIPVGSIDIGATPLAAILLNTIPNVNQVVDCSRISCTTDRTLGHAAALTPSAIRPTATLAALQAVLGNTTLNELIIGILPRSMLAWEQFPIEGLQLFTPRPLDLRYTLDYDLDCTQKAGLALTVKLPDGAIVVQGTTRVSYDDGTEFVGPNPTTDAETGARWTGLPDPCPTGFADRHIRLSFDALSGFDLGVGEASARVVAAGNVRSVANQAPVLVTQNWEANDEPTPTAPLVQPDQLVIGHVARSGDQEVFRTPIPTTPGTITTIYLSHIAEGADFDLVVSGPGSPPLQSSPVGSIPVGSIPIEDKGVDVENSTQALPPETLQDIPVGSIPVGSISANRGSEDEVAELVARGETGFYSIVVRGYNGSFSREPFVLRVRRTAAPTLPPCNPRGLTLGARGTLPPGVPADTKTLFLFNRQRMAALHGVADTNAMLASLATLAARPEVKGAILPVDGNTPVRNAYTAWDANPCNVEAANTVVRRINDVVTTYRTTLTDLRYVVLLGSDDALPMARVPDRVSVSPESDFASGLQFTTQNLQNGNAIYAASALSYFMTDGAYGAFTHIPWLGRELLLPQIPVSRLVETSADIKAQIDQYVAAGGVLDPESALTTGYDFLTDGAEATESALGQLLGAANVDGDLISDTWTRQDVLPRFTGATPPHDINAINAHFSQWQFEPASTANAQGLVTTADVPAPGLDPAFKDRILFSVGCHSGFNVPNTIISGPAPPQAVDWAESWARQRAAVYVANTGFGYGDTEANALSERLMSIFASKLQYAKPIGELWNDAQHEYFGGAGAYDVYDEKALVEATFFGLPFYRIQGAVPPPAPTPPPVVNDPAAGLPVARLSVIPNLAERIRPSGRLWTADGNTQVTHFRPIQPRVERDVTVPGQTAHGIIVTSLVTNDVGGVNPVLARPVIDLSGHEPEPNFRDVVFPANLVNLTRSRGLRGDRQGFVVNAGQFRPAAPPGPLGIERLVLSVGVDVVYSTSGDVTPPFIRQVNSSFGGGQATIVVDVTEPVRRVATLFNDTQEWRFAELSNVPGTTFWTATVPTGSPIEVFAMAQDTGGNVGYSTNKGFNFLSVFDAAGPEILIDSPLPRARYSLNQPVTASYKCSDPVGVQSCVGNVPDGARIDTSTVGPKTFTVTATDLGGRQTTKSVTYFVEYGFDGFVDPNNVRWRDPPKLNNAEPRDLLQFFFVLRDAGGNVIGDTRVVTSIYSRQIDCDSRPPEEPDAQTVPPDPDDFFFVPSKQSFKYMWHTEQAWDRTCRRLVFVLDDGTKHFLDFRFR